MILCSNPKAQYLARKDEIDAAISRVLDNGWYILGQEVSAFEEEFAAYTGAKFAVGVGSGTEALHLALRGAGIKPGDEVITVSHTAVATVAAIEMAGATPVLVDIEPQCFTINPSLIERAITRATRAIIPVHLYGHPAAMDAILEIANRHGIAVIEDCCQAHGADYRGRRVGSFGYAGCFSFYPTKNLGAIGDGGMVVTGDAALAERIRLLREYGWAERYVSHVSGWNSRLDEVQAAILRVKLRGLEADNEKRTRLAAQYGQGLAGCRVALPVSRPGATHVFHLYVIRSKKRDALQTFLKTQGIAALTHFPVPVHLQPAYRGRLRGSDSLPEAELAALEVLSLPMYPELSGDECEAVIGAVKNFEETLND